MNTQPSIAIDQMDAVVEDVLAATSFIDIHTHLFAPALGRLGLWGIDELLTYHYLEAELFRFSPVTPEQYWTLTKTAARRSGMEDIVCREHAALGSRSRRYRRSRVH